LASINRILISVMQAANAVFPCSARHPKAIKQATTALCPPPRGGGGRGKGRAAEVTQVDGSQPGWPYPLPTPSHHCLKATIKRVIMSSLHQHHYESWRRHNTGKYQQLACTDDQNPPDLCRRHLQGELGVRGALPVSHLLQALLNSASLLRCRPPVPAIAWSKMPVSQ
jgi:hypothetical protein